MDLEFGRLICGDFSAIASLECHIPKRKLQVFVSSTFTDTHLERNILMKEINPIVSIA